MTLRIFWLALFISVPGWGGEVRITVFHTNDIHGWIMERPDRSGEPFGGAAALAAVYRAEKGPKLLLDAGDWFQGTPEGTLTRGRALADVFNAVPYDAVEVGNHDFDFGQEALQDLVKRIKVPVLGANVYHVGEEERVGYLTPWIVKEVGGVKIGIFGLLTTRMRELSFPRHIRGLEFRREADEARDAVKALRAKGATVVIAVTHVGFESANSAPFEGDQTLANEVGGIDLIVGGHTHTPLAKPLHDAAHDTRIVQAGSGLAKVGKVILTVDSETGKATDIDGGLIDLNPERTGRAEDVQAIVDRYAAAADKELSAVVAKAEDKLERNRKGESSLGDWMTDCVRNWAGADAAFQNSGGIRADLPKGPVTLRTIFNIMPFDNRVVKLRMKGRLIRQVLEKGAGGGGVMQFSGLKVFYNRNRPAGERVESVSVDSTGRALEAERLYSVAAPDFVVEGGDGYTPFAAAAEKTPTDSLVRDVLRECARARPTIEAPPWGRMVFGEN